MADARSLPRLKALGRKEHLYKSVQEEIKAYILAHELKPGDPLPPETELSQQLNVSRNSVREAVKSLEALGVLEARPGAGLFVCAFSFDPLLNHLGYGLLFDLKQLTDLLEVRILLEVGMVPRVVAAVTPEQIARLRQVLDQMRRGAERGEYAVEADRQFHQVLYENTGNGVVGRLVDVFWAIFQQARERGAIPEPADLMDTYRHHAHIVDALEKRNLEEAHARTVRSFNGISRRLKQAQKAKA